MNILKILFSCITLLFFITSGVYAETKYITKKTSETEFIFCKDNQNNQVHKYKLNKDKCYDGQTKISEQDYNKYKKSNNDSDKKKNYDKDSKKYHQKKWDKKSKQDGAFTMIEALGKLILYNKNTGDVWVCSPFKNTCEQMFVENKDID